MRLARVGKALFTAGVLFVAGRWVWSRVTAGRRKQGPYLSGSRIKQWVDKMQALGQAHLFQRKAWREASTEDRAKFIRQVALLDAQYSGGLRQYVARARKLLLQSKIGANPFKDYTPKPPDGQRLRAGAPEHVGLEEIGMREVGGLAFVLVAGGLGERLGFSGIKLSLPSETTTGVCYLELYAQHILALQDRANRQRPADSPEIVLPLAIMTSDDTHDLTVQLLERSGRFGLRPGQVTLIKQEKVPSLADNDARFVVSPDDDFKLQTKPHGHGDVHALLYSSGVAKRWQREGRRWILFFQDTNGLVFRGLPAFLGVSKSFKLAMNSLTVPRRPGEPKGAICQLNKEAGDGKESLTINVEYNQLDAMLRSSGFGGDRESTTMVGDGAEARQVGTGFSPFPGNFNVLLFDAAVYAKVLDDTGGRVPEFVNPKYKNKEKTVFKKPTRLECMMQDFPRLLPPVHRSRVGFTQLDRWFVCSSVKNNPKDALSKYKKTGFAECASSGEADMYRVNRMLLSALGVRVQVEGKERVFAGVPTQTGAKIIITPRFACSLSELRAKFPTPEKVSISDSSTLILDGGNITVYSLALDGALSITSECSEAEVRVGESKTLQVRNKGDTLEPVDVDDKSVPEEFRIRGYRLKCFEMERKRFDKPGCYRV